MGGGGTCTAKRSLSRKKLYEMNRLYYRNLEQEQFQVRRLRHDMANHLQTMSGLPEPEMREYLNNIINSPALEHARRFCENNVVNIVLASKASIMEQRKIDMDIEISVPSEIPVQNVDLCAVFANSLDNAIEACEKLPDDQRKVTVKARTDKGLFVMRVQNPYSGKATWKRYTHHNKTGCKSSWFRPYGYQGDCCKVRRVCGYNRR